MFTHISKAFVACAALVPVSALAVPITVDFTVTATSSLVGNSYNGFPVGTVGTGSFTIDDSIGNYYDPFAGIMPIDFNLDWVGVNFTEHNAQLFSLQFDASGNLQRWAFGSIIEPGCGLNCVNSAGPADFYASGWEIPRFSVAAVHETDQPGWMLGDITWSTRTSSVPEPATFSLLGLGLLGIGLARRKRAV